MYQVTVRPHVVYVHARHSSVGMTIYDTPDPSPVRYGRAAA